MLLKDRFLDKKVLAEALLPQKLVQFNEEIADFIAQRGELIQLNKGETIIEQHSPERDVFFIIMGEASLVINGSTLPYTRVANVSVGELAALHPTLSRSATVKAATDPVVAVKLNVEAFQELAAKYPKIHEILNKDLAERLNQRNDLIEKQNEKPSLFIISTVESLNIAKQIKAELFHSDIDVTIWSQTDVFKGGDYTLEALEKAVKEADFGLAILQDDDIITSRDNEKRGPRDNVVFKLGLFMGLLTRKRTFIAIEKDVEQKLASDLQGITPLQYKRETNDQIDVSKLVYDLEILINDLGIRNKLEC